MEEKTARLFVALPVSSGFNEAFEGLSRKGLEGHWADPADLHITIRFLGDVPESGVDDITAALERVKRPPFSLVIDGLDAFHNKIQTILYADVVSTKKLTTLCAEITDVLTPLGFDFGMRPYVPHITLARLQKNVRGLDNYQRIHAAKMKATWQVTGFNLMQSASSDDKGARYLTLAKYSLSD